MGNINLILEDNINPMVVIFAITGIYVGVFAIVDYIRRLKRGDFKKEKAEFMTEDDFRRLGG